MNYRNIFLVALLLPLLALMVHASNVTNSTNSSGSFATLASPADAWGTCTSTTLCPVSQAIRLGQTAIINGSVSSVPNMPSHTATKGNPDTFTWQVMLPGSNVWTNATKAMCTTPNLTTYTQNGLNCTFVTNSNTMIGLYTFRIHLLYIVENASNAKGFTNCQMSSSNHYYYCYGNSSTATVNVVGKVKLTISPTNQTINAGSKITFTNVTSGGAQPYTYSYTVNQSGATENGNTFNFTVPGKYKVTLYVIDCVNQKANASAIITVLPTLAVGISPTLADLDVGSNASISSSVSGGVSPYTYQWYNYTTGNAIAISGANTVSYKFLAKSAGHFTYSVKVTDHSGNIAYSNHSNMYVNNSMVLGTIVPAGPKIDSGSSVTLSLSKAVSGGTPPYTYRWYIGSTLVSTGSSTYKFNGNTSTLGVSSVTLKVTDHTGINTTTSPDSVTVSTKLTNASIKITPVNPTIAPGQNVLLVANVLNGTSPYTYTWYIGSNQVGKNASTYTFNGNSSTIGISHVKVIIKDATGISATSPLDNVTVSSALTNNSITITPVSPTLDIGQNVLLTVHVSGGTSPYTYKWFIGSNAVGTNSTTYTFNGNTSTLGTDKVTVKVMDKLGQSATSAPDNVIVNSQLVNASLSITPTNPTINVGGNVILQAHVSGGTSPYTYQWIMGTNTVGTNSSTYTFKGNASTLGTNHIRVYVVDHASEFAISANDTVTVENALVNSSITITPTSPKIDLGQNVILTAHVSAGTAPYTYKWMIGSNTVGTNSSTYNFNGNTSTLGVDHVKVQVTDKLGTVATSASDNITVNAQLVNASVIITPANAVLGIGQNAIFTVHVAAGTSPYTYTWSLNGNTIGTNSNTITIRANSSILGSDKLKVHVVDTDGQSATSAPANITVTAINILGSPGITANNGTRLDNNEQTTLTANIIGTNPPFTINWIYNGNSIGTGNSIIFKGNSSTIGNDTIKLNIKDSKGNSSNSSIVVMVRKVSLTLTPASVTVNQGSSQSLTVNITGGFGPFKIEIFNITSNTIVGNFIIGSPSGSNSISIGTGSTGTFNFNAIATDDGASIPFFFASANNSTVIVTAGNAAGGGGTGATGGGGGGGGGGSGGGFLPTVIQTNGGACYSISNFSQDNTEVVVLNGQKFTITANFISPDSAGVSVNNVAYTMAVNQTLNVTATSNYTYTIELNKVLLIPLNDHTIAVSLCSQPVSKTNPLAPVANVTITITNGTVVVNSTEVNNTVAILVNGGVVSTGTGSAIFNTSSLSSGNYTIVGEDLNTSVMTNPKNFVKNALVPILNFIRECKNQNYTNSSCTTIAQITSIDNQVRADLYLNGKLIGTTNSTISNNQMNPGTYNYIFNTSGNADYTAAKIGYTYTIANAVLVPTQTHPLGNSWIYIALIILAIVLLLLIYLLAKRKKKQEPEEGDLSEL